ncbi:MAG: ParB/RepB/Spo0J family partition protein [Bacteroidales bacterium]|jgi:ParB family chromosome partitioning protein|nr:ParB/RepB/Spo0J family partition protein [Bacteroidales bacterium]MBQ2051867.1 ParB/RepB/Spo0J family partition protein [Paludibacteraceae bacterium]MBQ2591409.1 ParB/RepB/Spo0J family partition protein [Paludibacteraceae bacterium]MBR2178673.1 ParB/RepB/Spo0J family partition protein [Paludibacteraceae bacterium]
MAKKPALGRGLSSLLGGSAEEIKTSGSSIFDTLPISSIEPNPDQPRTNFDEEALDDLAESIKQLGVIQPITVRKISDDKYQIISGERRFRAAQKAGLSKIPSYIKTAEDETVMQMALVENVQREDLNAIEIALSYKALTETQNLTQEKISSLVGKKRATVSNYLRLLKLPAEIQLGISKKQIDMAHARALLSLDDPQKQLEIYEKAIKNNLSSHAVEAMVKEALEGGKKKREKKTLAPEYAEMRDRIQSKLNNKVELSCNNKGKGKISISFSNADELNKIIKLLGE